MKLSRVVLDAVKKAGIEVYFADRRITKQWNKNRAIGDLLMYGGWYWQKVQKGRVVQVDEDGPFRSESAAIRDSFVKLQLRPHA